VRLASALARKIRRGERTATSRWLQVPSRSSAENTSPAMTGVSNGKNQLPAKDSTTSAPAQPVACIWRPNRVSAGSEFCPLTTMTATAGPIQHKPIRMRTHHCASSLTSSKRYPRHTDTEGGASPSPEAVVAVTVIGWTPAPADR